MKTAALAPLVVLAMAGGALAQPQAPAPLPPPLTPGCRATPAELEANKKVAAEFFRPGINVDGRLALFDPGYIQHNPVYLKRAKETGKSELDTFREIQSRPPVTPPPGAPTPPPNNNQYLVMGECDLVSIIRLQYRQDPTAAPGTWYQAFAFDTFRVKNGKLIEHWDGALIAAPTPPAAPARP